MKSPQIRGFLGCGHALGGFIPLLHSLQEFPKGNALSSLLHPGRAGLGHSAGGERILQSTKCGIIYIYVCVYVDKTRQAAMVRSGAALRMLPLSGKCLGATSLDLEEFIWDFRRGHWGKVTDSGLLVLCVQRSRGWLCWTLHHLNIPRLQCLGRSRCRSGPGPAER